MGGWHKRRLLMPPDKGGFLSGQEICPPMPKGVSLALAEMNLDCCGMSVAVHCYVLSSEVCALI